MRIVHILRMLMMLMMRMLVMEVQILSMGLPNETLISLIHSPLFPSLNKGNVRRYAAWSLSMRVG